MAVLLWVPMVILAAYTATAAAALTRASDLTILPSSRATAVRRTASVLLAHLTWFSLGWLGLWLGCAVVLAENTAPIYWSMSMNGLALSALALVLGAWLVAVRAPAWVAALAAGGGYVVIAAWAYFPYLPASILFSGYGSSLFVDALPNVLLLTAQAIWAGGVLLTFSAWCARLLSGVRALALVGITAAATVGVASNMPYLVPRDGNIALRCEPAFGVQLCLWADHEHTFSSLSGEIALARRLAGAGDLPAYVVESNFTEDLPDAIPDDADVLVVPATAHPEERELAAALVAATISPNPACSDIGFQGLETWRVANVVRDAVAQGVSPRTRAERFGEVPLTPARVLSDEQIARWVSDTRRQVARCRQPALP